MQKGRGNRARYKPVAVELPLIPKSTSISAPSLQDQTTIISPPSDWDQADLTEDLPFPTDNDEGIKNQSSGKKGKVSCRSLFLLMVNIGL